MFLSVLHTFYVVVEVRNLRVLASATVDDITVNGGVQTWRVTVWALPPFDETKVYEIVTPIERTAAQEAIRRFCQEVEDASGAEP